VTEPDIVSLSGGDVSMLGECLGWAWVARLADAEDSVRHGAVNDLCEAIRVLVGDRHHSRVDGRGCTCGWNGDDLLGHFVETHQRSAEAEEGTVVFPLAIDKFDWSRPPGRLIKTWADAAKLTDQDVAVACGLPVEIYRGIISGSEHITTEIAVKLEEGTHTFPANVWLMLERNYRAALVERARQPHH
jgi:plasmid maintenance system antidote protein VapI